MRKGVDHFKVSQLIGLVPISKGWKIFGFKRQQCFKHLGQSREGVAAFGGREAVGRVLDLMVSWVKGLPWREVTSKKPITRSVVVYQLCQCPRETGASGKGSEGGEERQGKEKRWTQGKEMVKEQTNPLAHFACMVGGCLSFDQPLNLEKLPLHEGWWGHPVSTPRNQPTGTWLRSGSLEAPVWNSRAWGGDARTQGQIKASHRSLLIIVVAVVVS